MGWERRRRAVVAVAVAVSMATLAACGGRGGNDDPLAGGPPPEDIRLQPGDRPVRFRLDTAVTEADKAFIVEALGWAHVDLGDSGPLTVHVYSNEDHMVEAVWSDGGGPRQEVRQELADGEFAFATGGGHIWIYLPNFEQDPVEDRRWTIYHEYFHTVQTWLSELRFQSERTEERSFVPRWLVEGCAEYVAASAASARGIGTEAPYRGLMVTLTKESDESLASLGTEGGAGFIGGSGAAYYVGYLGCERLATTRGRDGVLHRFWISLANHRDWDKAFKEAFGLTPAAFYADFEAWRLTLWP
ncbi:MAG: hypothetical protein ACRD2W_21345 [Acidimicrobiales bacterium]